MKTKPKTDLEGKKPCLHKKTFFGMVGGRCVKCGGWITSLGQNPKNKKDTIYDDVKSILLMNAPFYERDDKDEYIYILRKYNMDVIADRITVYFKQFMSQKI